MKPFGTLTDPVYVEKEGYNSFERFWLKRMNDRKDLPFIHLLATIHIMVIPLAIILYVPLFTGFTWWLVAALHIYISQLYFKGRFGLMYHCICHRKMFKKQHQWIHNYLTWFVTPFFGHTPETYFGHHIGMHHMENNMPEDSSSTMCYQRDSISHFLRYYFRFLLFGFKDTFAYLYLRKRHTMYRAFFAGEIGYLIFYTALCFINLKATLVVFLFPLLFGRLVMMLGNWAQHAFIDPHNPKNVYTNSISCINTPYNKSCWNDGYHIIHHLRPGIHYTEMPAELLRQREALAANKAFVFDGIHYLHIFTYLVTKRYDKLACHLVNVDNAFSSEQEAILLMQQRTRKIDTN